MATYEYKNGNLKRIAGGTLFSEMAISTIVPFGGSSIPTGCLLCDGSAVSRTTYADLFKAIGTAFGSGDGSTTFNIPDMREATAKGAGLTSKSNNHLDADGLAVGEFIDDRIQTHGHGQMGQVAGGGAYFCGSNTSVGNVSVTDVRNARTGATTEVKSVGVNWIIKAQSVGVPADFASAIEDVIEEKFSYSTTEINTGRKWIDGKKIYRKVVSCINATVTKLVDNNYAHGISNFSQAVHTEIIGANGGLLGYFRIPQVNSTNIVVYNPLDTTYTNMTFYIILEYTKTS